MNLSKMSYKSKKKILVSSMLAIATLLIAIVIIAVFGQYMGTFVIGVSNPARNLGITLSETPDFENPTTKLLVDPVTEGFPSSFGAIKWRKIIMNDGNFLEKDDENYIAYTFYIKNAGNVSVDLSLTMDSIQITKNADEALRVAVIEDGYVTDKDKLTFSKAQIYSKVDDSHGVLTYDQLTYVATSQEIEDLLAIYDSFTLIEFEEKDFIENYVVDNFMPNETRKFTIVIWLEGWDKDCDNKLMGGKIKLNFKFSILEREE